MTAADPPHRPTLVELDVDRCLALVQQTPVGRLGFVNEEGDPMILPVNHVLVDGQIHVRTKRGTKLSVAERLGGAKVVLEVDELDADLETGWSVLVRGHLHPVTDTVEMARLDRLGHHTWSDDTERRSWLRVDATEVTGRGIATPDAD
ncbi:MAG: pyridoxamine 5'-phosphate oxidase family protein [Actinomycetota bacterium]